MLLIEIHTSTYYNSEKMYLQKLILNLLSILFSASLFQYHDSTVLSKWNENNQAISHFCSFFYHLNFLRVIVSLFINRQLHSISLLHESGKQNNANFYCFKHFNDFRFLGNQVDFIRSYQICDFRSNIVRHE